MAAYPPERFTDQSLDAAIEIARACKFATLVHADGDTLITVHAPLSVVDGPHGATLIGHIARNNPLVAVLQAGSASARLIFLPAEGYVSPQVYAEKPRSAKVVPTWNYVAAHLDGTLALVDDRATLLQTLDRQTADYEGMHGGDWQVADAPDAYIDAMSKAIVAVVFTPQSGIAMRKLSQNRPEDVEAVTAWLTDHELPARDMAYWMQREVEKL